MKSLTPVIIITLLLVYIVVTHYLPKRVIVEDTGYYHALADKIDDYYRDKGINRSSRVIYSVVSKSAEELSKFKDSPFTLTDILAIAALESEFNERSIGKYDERGIFQILDYKTALNAIGYSNGNPHDPMINTKMGMWILKNKYKHYKDYKMAIMSYNGLVPTTNGLSQKYWNNFNHKRKIISEIVKSVNKERTLDLS